MNAAAERHLSAAASHIAVAESGDVKRAAYEKAADEILAAQAKDPNLSQAEVGRRISKSPTWVKELLGWRRRPPEDDRPTPWARDPENDFRARHEAKKVPTRPEDRVEMAVKLLADPDVAAKALEQALAEPSKASRLIENTVAKKGAERRRKQMEAAQRQREDSALQLPAYMNAMVMKMAEWEAGMRDLEDDLDDLPEGRGRELVGETAQRLGETAYRWVDRVRQPGLVVIEGGKAG